MSPASTHPQRNRKDGGIKMWCLAAKGCGGKEKRKEKKMMEREKVVVVLVLVLHASRP